MKKTMVRIFAAVLVLAMAIGFLAMIPASAATESVQFFSNNVKYDDCMKLMYAVYNPQNEAYTIKLTANGEECGIIMVEENANVNGTYCTTYVSEYGVPLQNIATVITAELYVGNDLKDTCTYSVLEYLHEMQTIIGGGFRDEDLSVEERTAMLNMYDSLLESAASIQTVLSGSSTIGNYGYVYLTNGTINGKQGALLNVGTTITTNDLAVDGVATSWQYKTVGGEFADLPEEGLEIANNNYILTAEIEESTEPTDPSEPEETTPTETDYSGRYYIATNRSSGNYFYMTSDLGSASTKRYTAKDSELSALPEKITDSSDGYVFVLEANEEGTYYIYAESSDSANYLGWTSGNSGSLVDKDNALKLTVDKAEAEGLYNIHFAASDAERYLALNGSSGNDYFAWYKSGQKQDLALIPVEECEHTNSDGVVIDPTCTEAGYTAYTCTKCGFITKTDEVAAPGHTYDSEVTQDATCTDAGVTTYTCSVCDDSYTEKIEALGHSYVDGVCKWCGETESSGGEQPKDPKWVLVTDVSKIKDGDKILIVNTANSKAMSTTQNSNNRGAASVTIENGMISEVGADVQQITLVQNGTNWNLMTDEGQYLYAASTTKNYLKTSNNNTNGNAIWSIAIDSNGVATIKADQSARNWMRFNLNSGNNIFSCYTSGQLDVVIFVLTTDY